jgi:hypothetical protein
MGNFSLHKTFTLDPACSEKSKQVMRIFGLNTDQFEKQKVKHHCKVKINDGNIVYITGPSGAGKSVLMRELRKAIGKNNSVSIDEIKLANDKTVVDCVDGNCLDSLRLLSTVGLNDVYCVLNKPAWLSEGQKWRFRLAMALATKKPFIFADEFCSNLDRISAAVISFNIRKFANKAEATFICASAHDDVMADLLPDVIITKNLDGTCNVTYP